jgi:SAM-dependent methyltransferase
MAGHRASPPTFAAACEAVLAAPERDHSTDTTLAPVHARLFSDEWGEQRARVLTRRFPSDIDRVLEVGCGVGLVLNRLAERYDAVGVDDRAAHLQFAAARGVAVVRGHPTAPPVRNRFDGVCATEYATAQASAVDICVGAYAALRPGGLAVVVAPTAASGVAESGVETFSGSRYRLERAVDIESESTVAVDYRVTDRRTGGTAVTTERREIRTTTADGLTAAFRTAGFEDVLVSGESDLPGVVIGVGARPVETGR